MERYAWCFAATAAALFLAGSPADAISPPIPSEPAQPGPASSGPAQPAAATEGSSLEWWQTQAAYAASVAAAAGGAAATAIGSGAEASAAALSSFGQAVGEFGWEVTFALGVNSVPLSLPSWNPFSDPEGQATAAAFSESLDPNPAAPEATPAVRAAVADVQAPVSSAPVSSPDVSPAASSPAGPAPVPPAAAATASRPMTAAELVEAATPEPPQPANPVSAEIVANLLGDQPRRETDGSFLVPKAAQRLLDIRTARAVDGAFPVTVKLAGRIIPDPNAHGVVEATIAGRIEAPPGGLPALGALVHEGDVLASVVPAIGVVDRTQIRRDVARLTNEIRVATENIEILKQFWFVPYREGKIIQAEIQLRGLRRERAALLPLLDTREVLRAPTDGVVSVTKAIAGQVVQPGTPVFDIVNPDRLWVEASAPSPEIATVATGSDSAAAVTPEGQALDLRFVGTGLTAREQATLLQFRIENPPEGLRVDRPVTVIVASRDRSRHGVVVLRESVVTGAGGLDEVWEHVDPEHFRARPVRIEPLDGRHLLVLDGLTPGSRIVVHSARLLAQYE